ncbi:aminopeptidase P N-terminal domain-containing protein [Candidatus Symbiobacter mobilis]|uniref:Xaa-Pro aminopeptidase n=1 Tax=Candidatus Symbiobacter mobilis CR TaxID=946483 RepID=U5NBK0_9BURK|nr:aminopeptidase P N-terminal domain-containing protein [Candidatus Symbiobacter mobilis]AGX87618.1 Xaa-Pro aminopeptidase [Candidatus Symbiobacter mobilis CR]
MTSTFALSVYDQRRRDLARRIGPNAVALLPTAPMRLRNRDVAYPYRHDSAFHYLCGFGEADAWLVLTTDAHSTPRTTLFCLPRDPERETWNGLRLGPDAAPAALGIDEAFAIDVLDARMPELLAGREALWYPFGADHELRVHAWLRAVRNDARFGRRGVPSPWQTLDLCNVIDDMRLYKTAHETRLMRHAARISASAHSRAMRFCAQQLRAGEEVREYHLEAELLHEFRSCGAQAAAYESVVATGANACILHYPAGSTPVRAGDLVLVDAGCELDGYASDITRTFPAIGTFTSVQRELYTLVLAAQQAAIAAIRPGARFVHAHEASVRVLSQGMLDLGLLRRDVVGTVDDVIAHEHYRRFYMHRTSHWIGMDVHDCGAYMERGERSEEPPAPSGTGNAATKELPSRILHTGMMLTVEPGLYVRPSPDVPEPFHGIGIRIEDEALVTPSGCELLTRDVPVLPEELTALMLR